MEPSTRQRSRKGCLTCRQKRKKCDEVKPICGRCKGGDDCSWPVSQTSRPCHLARIQPYLSSDFTTTDKFASTETMSISVARKSISANVYARTSTKEALNAPPEILTEGNFHPFASCAFLNSAPVAANSTNSSLKFGDSLPGFLSGSYSNRGHPLEHKLQGVLPTTNAIIYTDYSQADYTLDENEEVLKKVEWLPGTIRLLSVYLPLELPHQDGVQWPSAIDSYFAFHIHYSYDLTKLPTVIEELVIQSGIESVRLGVLANSVLYYSGLNPDLPQAPLRSYAHELVGAAAAALQFERSQSHTTLGAQLAGILEILGFYYYLDDIEGCMRCIEQASPIVRRLVGTAPMNLHKFYGPETLDIRAFVWCDIFSSIATSRPTRLVYDGNIDALLYKNQQGPCSGDADDGLEWMTSIPDAFLLLTIQIINIKHSSLSYTERFAQAATIEAALRSWKIWPAVNSSSATRIHRVSAQEIWRHFVILYLYQAIYRATPRHEAVQESVKQIVKLASTLPPGHNPDRFLDAPYFLAGTFAVSEKHRQFLRHRVLSCSSVYSYAGHAFANALDELWQQTSIDEYLDWTSRNPPLVML